MKDFRQQVKTMQRSPSESEIKELLRKGHLKKAIRKARVAGYVIPQENIDTIATAMFRAGRAGELLGMIGKVNVKLPYDATSLLICAFEARDYHNFLKHVHRLGITAQHGERIKEAIKSIEQNAPSEANVWYRKLREIIEES